MIRDRMEENLRKAGYGPAQVTIILDTALKGVEIEAVESRYSRALSFMRSVIKSGEGWSDTCEQMYKEATGRG